jgi:hypothetical protein
MKLTVSDGDDGLFENFSDAGGLGKFLKGPSLASLPSLDPVPADCVDHPLGTL